MGRGEDHRRRILELQLRAQVCKPAMLAALEACSDGRTPLMGEVGPDVIRRAPIDMTCPDRVALGIDLSGNPQDIRQLLSDLPVERRAARWWWAGWCDLPCVSTCAWRITRWEAGLVRCDSLRRCRRMSPTRVTAPVATRRNRRACLATNLVSITVAPGPVRSGSRG